MLNDTDNGVRIQMQGLLTGWPSKQWSIQEQTDVYGQSRVVVNTQANGQYRQAADNIKLTKQSKVQTRQKGKHIVMLKVQINKTQHSVCNLLNEKQLRVSGA